MVTGFGGDDELVAVRLEVVSQVPAEIRFGAAAGRTIVVGEIEVRDAEFESAAKDGPLRLKRLVVTEVMPEAQRDSRKFQTTPTDPSVRHRVVAVLRGDVIHVSKFLGLSWSVTVCSSARGYGRRQGPVGAQWRPEGQSTRIV